MLRINCYSHVTEVRDLFIIRYVVEIRIKIRFSRYIYIGFADCVSVKTDKGRNDLVKYILNHLLLFNFRHSVVAVV